MEGHLRLTGQSQMSLLSIVEQIILTGQSHLSLSEPQSKYIDVYPPLGLTEK